ncbi:MAG: hypothetical protein IJU84_03285, partial [Clostridia bacterium]|nr:hypothetical protein [Clostridia bacterium]
MKKLFLILIISALAACSVPKVSAAYAKFDFGADYSVAGRNTADGSYIVSAINVKDFGAAGDGVTDDTSAFEEAFEAVILGPRGGVLFIPAGEYRVTRPGFRLTAGVTVMGVGNRKGETGGETLIIADFPNDSTKPLFEMTSNTSIMNLSVYYKRQNINDVTAYPYTISTEENYACFVTIRNITLYNSFKGVNTVGGAQHVANVSGTVLDTGIEVGGNAEVSEYMNCRFDSSFWAGKDGTDRAKIAAYTVDRATGMKIGYVDDIFIYNVNFPKTEFSEGVYFYLNGASRAAGASGIAYGFVYKAEDTE